MRIVHSWLNELAPFGDDVDAIAATMTDLGLAVEEIIHVGATVDGVITARVVRTERHPDAAKVHRVYVDAGDGSERHVWCGAFNMQAGDIVPLATPGTAMPDGRPGSGSHGRTHATSTIGQNVGVPAEKAA